MISIAVINLRRLSEETLSWCLRKERQQGLRKKRDEAFTRKMVMPDVIEGTETVGVDYKQTSSEDAIVPIKIEQSVLIKAESFGNRLGSANHKKSGIVGKGKKRRSAFKPVAIPLSKKAAMRWAKVRSLMRIVCVRDLFI